MVAAASAASSVSPAAVAAVGGGRLVGRRRRVVVVGAGRGAERASRRGRRPPAGGGVGASRRFSSSGRTGVPDRVKGALLCFACGLDASRRRPACWPGPPRRSTAARWPSCGSRSGAVGLLSAARIVAYGWIDSPLRRARPTGSPTSGFGWVPQPTAAADARRWWRCSALASAALAARAGGPGWRRAGLLREPRVDRADRRHHLPQPLLVPHPASPRSAVVAPLGRALSLDARRAGGPATVAAGWVWLLRFQVGVVYAFAGLAKLQPDWLVRALPARALAPGPRRRAGARAAGRHRRRPPTSSRSPAPPSTASSSRCCCGGGPGSPAWLVLVGFHVVHVGAVPDRRVPVADDRRVHGVLRARLAAPAARPGRPPGRGAAGRAGAPLAGCWLVLAVAVGGRAARAAAAPPRLPRRPPLDRPGLPLRLERAAGREGRQRDVPRARAGAPAARWVADPTELYTRTQLRVMASEPDLIHQAAIAIAADERAPRPRRRGARRRLGQPQRPPRRAPHRSRRSTSPPSPATPGPTTGSSPRPTEPSRLDRRRQRRQARWVSSMVLPSWSS